MRGNEEDSPKMNRSVRQPGSWMQLPIDDRIVEVLEFSGLVLSPSIIAYNIDKSREEVSRRLQELVKRRFVDRVERGKYQIAERGQAYLAGDLDATEFDG